MAKELTEDTVSKIRALVAEGRSYNAVSRELGVSPATISRVARDLCQRSRGRPKREASPLSEAELSRLKALIEALHRFPGRKEARIHLRMDEREFERLRYLAVVHGYGPLRSRATGRPPLRREVERLIERRVADGEDRELVIRSLTPRQLAALSS